MVASITDPDELRHGKVTSKKAQLMTRTTGEEIFIGDIIKLEQNQISPCDILLLASSDSLNGKFMCRVDTMLDNGKCLRQQKDVISLTKAFNLWTEDDRRAKMFLNRLTARVCYQIFEDTDNIVGAFKIKSDPKVENFDITRVVKKGSQLKSRYVYGLVLYNGEPAFKRNYFRLGVGKVNGVQRSANTLTILLLVINVILSVLSSLLYIRVRNFEGPKVHSQVGFITHFSLYTSVLPLSINLFLNLFDFFAAIILRLNYKEFKNSEEYQKLLTKKTKIEDMVSGETIRSQTKINKSTSALNLDSINSLNILNPKVLADLGDIDEVFFDKTGTLSTYSYDVRTIAAKDKLWTSKRPNFVSSKIDEMKAKQGNGEETPHPDSTEKEGSSKNFLIEKEDGLGSNDQTKKVLLKTIIKENGHGLNAIYPAGLFPVLSSSKDKIRSRPPSAAKPLENLLQPDLFSNVMNSVGLVLGATKNLNNERGALSDGLTATIDEEEFYKDFQNRTDIQELVIMFALCHSAKAISSDSSFKGNVIYESNHIEERALLKMAKNYGVSFMNTDDLMDDDDDEEENPEGTMKNYVIGLNGEMLKVEYYFLLDHDPKRNRFSILVKQADKNRAKLYVRGLDESMKNLLDSEKSKYDFTISHNTQKGLKSFVFASKTISLEEAERFQKDYTAAKRTTLDQDVKLSNLAKLLESNLELEAIVGLRNSLKEDAQESVNQLREMGLQAHLLSGDDLEHCLMAAYAMELMPTGKKETYFLMDFEDKESGKGVIKRALDQVAKGIVKLDARNKESVLRSTEDKDINHKVLSIVISGRALNVIANETYFKDHFKFILEFTKVVIGYQFSAVNKSQVVEMYNQLNKKTLAVGDGFNDVMMLKTAKVGVQIFDRKMPYFFGDIVANNSLSIIKAMRLQCRSWNTNLILSLHNMYKYSLIMVFCSVYFQVYCQFSGSTLFTAFFITTAGAFTVFISLFYVFLCPQIQAQTRNKMLALYTEKNYLTKLINVKTLFYKFLPECLIVAALMTFLTLTVLDSNTRASGILENKNILVVSMQSLCILYFSYTTISTANNRKAILSIIIIIILGSMGLTLYVLFNTSAIEKAYRYSIQDFFTSWNDVTHVAILSLFIFTISSSYWNFYLKPAYFPVCSYLREIISSKDKSMIEWIFSEKNSKKLPMKFCLPESFASIYKKCFSESKGSESLSRHPHAHFEHAASNGTGNI